jgi:hypothetical protein
VNQSIVQPAPVQSPAEIIGQLNASANTGNPEALVQLRAVLEQNPEVYHGLGELARHVETMLISKIVGTNAALREALILKCKQMRTDLLGVEPTPLEKAAADRVICCWLEVHLLDVQFGAVPENMDRARKLDVLKNSAHRRYDSALRSLGLVKQKLPAKKKRKPKVVRNRFKIIRYSA